MSRRSLREITGPGPVVGWGWREAVGVVIAAHAVLIVAGSIVVGAAPRSGDVIPLPRQFLGTMPFWIAALALSWWVASRPGDAPDAAPTAGPAAQLGLGWRPIDVPIGVVVGVAMQLLVIPAVYLLFGADLDELERPAQQLADSARGSVATVLFVLMTCLFAPIAEEVLYRGVLQRGAGKASALAGVVVAAVVFGLAHFQALQLPGLVLFGAASGLAVWWTGRLGTGIMAHMAFNASTVVVVLWRR